MKARLVLHNFKTGAKKILGVAFNSQIKGNSLELLLQEMVRCGLPEPKPSEDEVLISEPVEVVLK